MTKFDSNPLLSITSPPVVSADLHSEAARNLIEEAGLAGVVVELDGAKARSLDDFFSKLAQDWEFPDYFGRNWPAFKDCLADLEWLPADSYCLVVKNSDLLFSVEPVERAAFLYTMKLIADEWATPVELGEWWDRPAIPFHTVLDSRVFTWNSNQLAGDEKVPQLHIPSGQESVE